MGCFESFYVLEALPQRWSQCHLFKCNCPECFKTASCVHCILASMVCNPFISVPARCLGATIQGRRRRGRPCARGSDVSDVAEARSRERLELGMEYRMPKVSMSMLLTCFVYFLSACIQQEPFAAEIIESDDDFAWLRSVMEAVPRIGSNDIGAARSRDAGCWPTAASPSLHLQVARCQIRNHR